MNTKILKNILLGTVAAVALAAASTSAHAAIIVDPTAVVPANSSEENYWWSANYAIDGSGLSNASLVANGANDVGALGTNIAALPTHVLANPDYHSFFHLRNDIGSGAITGSGATASYALSSTFDINGVYLWNYAETDAGNPWPYERGVKQVTFRFIASDQSTLLSTQTVSFAKPATGATFAPEFKSFSTVTGAKYVQLTFDTNWGSTYATGYGEIRFTAVPEPSTWALLAGGLTAVMVLRRRRA